MSPIHVAMVTASDIARGASLGVHGFRGQAGTGRNKNEALLFIFWIHNKNISLLGYVLQTEKVMYRLLKGADPGFEKE